jgi:hypothetical protein
MFLDQRTGMSYGFFARQLPMTVRPAQELATLNGKLGSLDWDNASVQFVEDRQYVCIRLNGHAYVVEVPEVWVMSTRSGCKKTNINPRRDLVRMGLSRGRVIFETPAGITSSDDCKPSYDTITILAHALGNALIASILMTIDPKSEFPSILRDKGITLSHWHDYPQRNDIPDGYYMHGTKNPPVSCSTPQSALYSLLGKFTALKQSLDAGTPYLGDVHIEPHHGTNMVGCLSLYDVAIWNYEVTKGVEYA